MFTFYDFFYFRFAIIAVYYDIPTYSVKNSDTTVITDTTDRYGPIITVGGVGGDFSHTPLSDLICTAPPHLPIHLCLLSAVFIRIYRFHHPQIRSSAIYSWPKLTKTDSCEWRRLSEISPPPNAASVDAAKFATASPVERTATTTTSAASSRSTNWLSVHLYYIIQTHVHLLRFTISHYKIKTQLTNKKTTPEMKI